MESPYKNAADSPSRQVLWELGRLQIDDQEKLYERLDQDNEDKEWLHREALLRAAAEHEQVRRDAELYRQRLEAEEELKRDKRRQEELKALQRLKQSKIEEEAALRREAVAAEEAARRADEQRRAFEEAAAERVKAEKHREAVLAAQKQAAEEEHKTKLAEAQAKAKEAVLAARKKQLEQEKARTLTQPKLTAEVPQPATTTITSTRVAAAQDGVQSEHEHYLRTFRRLKELRQYLKDQSKSNAALKKAMGDGRRTIRKCVGQLSSGTDPQANRAPNVQLRNTIRESLNMTEPQVSIADYVYNPPASLVGIKRPALLIYFLNIFSKCLIAQFVGEVAVAPMTASAIGITGATIFSQEDFRVDGVALIDIFIAKLHRVCPVLFGIYGDDRTEAGKKKLGWWWSDNERTQLCTEQTHYDRMTGLGAGFAALTLRSFKRTTSPYPPWHYWRAMARIMNVPKNEVTNTHLVVLKSMIEGNEARILDFFGEAGLVALRVALKEFPLQVKVKNGVAAQALLLIPDVLKSEKRLFL